MTAGESQALEPSQPLPEIGNSPEIADTIFRVRAGDVSAPIRTDKGFAVLSVTNIQPAHAATLAEVRDKVLADFRRDKSVDLAKTRADEACRRA